MSVEGVSFASRVRDELERLGGVVSWRVEHRDLVSSTMNEARRLAGGGAGRAIVAESQSAGRGRRERVFVSPPGGLYVTAILEGPPRVEDAWRFSFSGALAAARALESLGVEGLRFEWPNDLFEGSRKVGGVLAELLAGAAVPHSVAPALVLVGVGLNTGPDPGELDAEHAGPAGALTLGEGDPRAELCARLLFHLERYATLAGDPTGWADVLQSVRDLSALRGERAVHVRRHDGSEVRGVPWALLDDGSLELRASDGSVQRVRYGEVVHA